MKFKVNKGRVQYKSELFSRDEIFEAKEEEIIELLDTNIVEEVYEGIYKDIDSPEYTENTREDKNSVEDIFKKPEKETLPPAKVEKPSKTASLKTNTKTTAKGRKKK